MSHTSCETCSHHQQAGACPVIINDLHITQPELQELFKCEPVVPGECITPETIGQYVEYRDKYYWTKCPIECYQRISRMGKIVDITTIVLPTNTKFELQKTDLLYVNGCMKRTYSTSGTFININENGKNTYQYVYHERTTFSFSKTDIEACIIPDNKKSP